MGNKRARTFPWILSMILLGASASLSAREVRIGNPGKSLNFFIFVLARERDLFREEGLDLKVQMYV